MEHDTPLDLSLHCPPPVEDTSKKRRSVDHDETDADSTIHAFNTSNITVIERLPDTAVDAHLKMETAVDVDPKIQIQDADATEKLKTNSCEGSDSGVEVLETGETCVFQRTLSANSENVQEFRTITPAQSYDSSIISCYSHYDEAYNVLARRNSTLFEDYKLRNGDGTSEGGSESSSVASTRDLKRCGIAGAKKKVLVVDKSKNPASSVSSRSRTKPPTNQKCVPVTPGKGKADKLTPKTPNAKQTVKTNVTRSKPTPDSLSLNLKKDVKKTATKLATTAAKTPQVTPTDDGRWPSVNSKPAPLLTRSLRGALQGDTPKLRTFHSVEAKNTLEKYGTLPRRRKEKSADSLRDVQNRRPNSRDSSATRSSLLRRQNSREGTPSKSLPPYPRKKPAPKTKIYHEMSIQTALTISDIEKALSGLLVNATDPKDVDKCEMEVQVDMNAVEVEKLLSQLKESNEKYDRLSADYAAQKVTLDDTVRMLKDERMEKDGLKEELRQNTERVLAILGDGSAGNEDENTSSDSLLMLESRFQNVREVIINQENEISKLNKCCRDMQRELDKRFEVEKRLLQQQQEMQEEGAELNEFMQAEKVTLSDALKDAESEIKKYKLLLVQKDKEVENKQEECKHLVRISEQRRQDTRALQARLDAIEAKGRELLVHQGSNVSGAAVALSGLISRLDGLVEELVSSYSISQQELDDVIFHNEAYSNSSSSPEASPGKFKSILKDKSPSPKRGSNFISAVINAIRNATSQATFSGQRDTSRDTVCTDNSDSTEMLDSETEPCLMMEPVLEDVVIPDGHSHNMISSSHGMLSTSRLTHSESLNNLSQAILNRQMSEQASISLTESLNASFTSDMSSMSDLCSSVSLVDQVIEVDNLITRLLKVIRIIQMENEDVMNELQDDRDSFCHQVEKQRDTNKVVVKQLKDWEILGARLKSEVKELMQQLSKKNGEIEDIKCELNNQRKEVEKLNQDVCELSTALSKSELESKIKDEEVTEALKIWESQGDMPPNEVLGRILVAQNEVASLKGKLEEKEKQLKKAVQDNLASKQVLTDNLRKALIEGKKQYEAIDNVLGILHSIQITVDQHPALARIQQDLEKICMQTVPPLSLVHPPDYNANAGMIQAMANLEIASQ